MPTYTADAVALLAYLVDRLPGRADEVFADAEAGRSVVQAPAVATAEALYAVSQDKTVRGVDLAGSPVAVRSRLLTDGPVSTVPAGDADLAAFAELVHEYSIHDALLLASHRVRGTDAIITSDERLVASEHPTIWAE